MNTERVSVDFGLIWTLSNTFEVLGCDLPQHLPHHQFSSVNSTEGADRLPHSESGQKRYPNILHPASGHHPTATSRRATH
jgi:hypothetical protein